MKKLTKSNHVGEGIKNKAFTLIELLAVIVILAVIALISIPIVLSILTKVRKSAFKDSAYGIMEAAKSYFAEMIIDENNPEDKVFSFENGVTNDLSYSGSKPKGGVLILSKSGEIELAIYNNEWCAIKNKTENNVKLIKYEKDKCIIADSAKDPVIILNGEKEITLKVGDIYAEEGVIAKTVDGTELSYKVEIEKDGKKVESVDTNEEGVYTIIYKVVSNSKEITALRTIIVQISNADTTGAEKPSLTSGLIPIKWNGSVWIRADENNASGANQWYDYNSQMWANAVIVTSAYRNVSVGTVIPESEVLAYFVWIPRYEYDYVSIANYAGGTQDRPGEIKIHFIETSKIIPSTNYKIHPAFTFGTEELSGIWVGKFETTGDGTNPTIKPNLRSLTNQNVSTQFAI